MQASPSSPGPFRQGATTGTCFADFDQSYEAISPSSQTATSTTYTVRDGETLASVAQTVWGDASLWYVLADANGLDYDSVLVAGQLLTLPNRPTNQHNSADTFRPYDPATALGDTQPAAPNPPKKKKKCGVFGIILRVVVAAVVAAVVVVSLGTAVPAVAAAVIGGAVGSAASQGVAIATGMQSKFSFKQVAIAGISAGVGQFVGSAAGLAGNSFLQGAARGAIGSVATQGIAVATGLQNRFDWAGVATAAVIGGVSAEIQGRFDKANNAPGSSVSQFEVYGQRAVSGTAAAIAGATARSLLTGTDFGDNLLATLPDVIGSTIGNMAADAVLTSSNGSASQPKAGILTPDQEAAMFETLVPASAAATISLVGSSLASASLSPAATNAIANLAAAENSYQSDGQNLDADIIVTANKHWGEDLRAVPQWAFNNILAQTSEPWMVHAAAHQYLAGQGLMGAQVQIRPMASSSPDSFSLRSAFQLSLPLASNDVSGGYSFRSAPTLSSAVAADTAFWGNSAPIGVGDIAYIRARTNGASVEQARAVQTFGNAVQDIMTAGIVSRGRAPDEVFTTKQSPYNLLTAGQSRRAGAADSAAFQIGPASQSLILRPVEIEFPARGLSAAEQRLFSAHLAEQQSTLNRLSLFSPDDLALNLQNYQNIAPQVARARGLARGYLSGPGKGQDAAHALDSVAGGYVNEFAGFRDPVQQRIGALWRTRSTQIVPGREHMLTPRFDK